MEVNCLNNVTERIKIGNCTFENVINFTYLGVKINNKGTVSEKMNNKISADRVITFIS